jgi:hypothetical protein
MPTLFVVNPEGPIPFSWDGNPLTLPRGLSEWPQHIALHVVGKFPAYSLSFYPTKAAAQEALDR